MKVAAYVRISTESQMDGYGLEVQRAAVATWAKANGHKIVAVLADEGISGTKELDDRPALGDALAMVKRGEAGAIVVPKLDRLARDLVIQETLISQVGRMGGRIFSCVPGEDANLVDTPDDPSRKLVRQILGAVAEYDRQAITLRLASGRRRKATNGGYAYGSPGYGYRADHKALAPVEREQEAIDLMVELRNSGASLRTICDALTAKGFHTKRDARWQPNTVARILARQGSA